MIVMRRRYPKKMPDFEGENNHPTGSGNGNCMRRTVLTYLYLRIFHTGELVNMVRSQIALRSLNILDK